MMVVDETKLRERYEQAGQGHVFDYVPILSEQEKIALLEQLNSIKVEEISSLLQSARDQEASVGAGVISTIEPFVGNVGRSSNKELLTESYAKGIELISQRKVAALVLAGGQGTRLGYGGPKGMYNIGLPSQRTLFQLVAQRILRISTIASEGNDNNNQKQLVPFYIMTSPLNHDETVEYFRSVNYFGLGESNVYFFQQGMLPCVELTTDKIIMETPSTVAMAPDGNGGIYPSLQLSGALTDMKQRGIEYLHVFSIDNALVKPADPVFVGYCVKAMADCGNKVVWKAHPHEAVGVVAMRNNKPCIVEYSEITKEMAEQTDENGTLLFGAGNICNHFYTIDFIENIILPNMGTLYHIAKKKISYYDNELKQTITPTANNGIKLETFIFDVFPLSERMAVLDVERSEEFAPVKNASGADSPETARQMITALSKKYLVDAGAKLVENTNDSTEPCEISPLISYAGEGLEQYNGQEVPCPFSI